MSAPEIPVRLGLRWDLALRLLAGTLVPILLQALINGSVLGPGLVVGFSAALVGMADLGPELRDWRWVGVCAAGVPAAVTTGAWASGVVTGGVLMTFVLFTGFGALLRAGMPSQLAGYSVATAGMLAALLFSPQTGVLAAGLAAAAGSVWALLLMWVVARIPFPRLPVPPEALAVDTSRLVRMVRSPRLADWIAPLLLGLLSAGLLAVANALTGGYRPYWAVLAFVGALQPSAAKIRASVNETVLSTVLGVGLAAVVLSSDLTPGVEVLLLVLAAVVGALIMLAYGVAGKALLTPLPVVLAAGALEGDDVFVLQLRLVEYLAGAGLALGVVFLAEILGRGMWAERADTEDELIG